MSQPKTVRKALDLAKLAAALKLKQETTQALNAFRKRHEELLRMVGELQESRQSIDFQSYRSILKNQKIVDEAESVFKNYVPSAFPLEAQFKVIQAFQTISLEKAAETERQLQEQLKDLNETLKNIKEARPVEELSMEDIVQAVPSIDATVTQRSKNHDWIHKDFEKKFGDFSLL
ncbi:ATP synthase d subunit [Coelomomyces lativittatus]|nr:ATP synthase d subunit [Coelomomyces lativittatus]